MSRFPKNELEPKLRQAIKAARGVESHSLSDRNPDEIFKMMSLLHAGIDVEINAVPQMQEFAEVADLEDRRQNRQQQAS